MMRDLHTSNSSLDLSTKQRQALERLARPTADDLNLALRAQLILDWAEGLTSQESAARRQTSRRTVSKWRCRFRDGGVAALADRPRPGAPRTIPERKVDELYRLLASPPPRGEPRWTTRMLARHTGLSQSTVMRLKLRQRPPGRDHSWADGWEDDLGHAVGIVATSPR